jgi:hypothetical protein
MSHTVLGSSNWQICDSTSPNYFVPLAEDRLLVFAIALENNPDTNVTGITWGGQSLTQGVEVVTTAAGVKGRAEIWYLKETDIAAAGDQGGGLPFNITWSAGEPAELNCAATSYKFVDQTTPIGQTTTIEDSTVPITNPLSTTLTSDAGTMTVAVGVCGNVDDYYWDPYWNERIDQNNGITMTIADRIVSTLTPIEVSIDFQGTLDTYQALAAMEIHRSSTEAPEIQLAVAAGGNTASGNVVEFDMVIPSGLDNKFLVITPGYEFAIDETGYTSLVQVNGEDAIFVASETAGCVGPGCVGIHNTTDMYYIVAPSDGTNTIRIECTMDVGVEPRDFSAAAACLFNVGPPDILSIKTDFDNEPLPTDLAVQHPTEDLTGNSIIVDSIVMGNPNPAITGNSNQIKIADAQAVGAASSRATLAFKYSESTPLGESSWSQLAEVGQPGLRAAMVSMAIESYSDSTSPTFICTDSEVEDVTLEFCEQRDLFRMSLQNQGDSVDLEFKFDTCTLQVLTLITSGTSSRSIRFTYDGSPKTLTPNDTDDVSSESIYLVPVGPYYLPTLILEKEYSITFI